MKFEATHAIRRSSQTLLTRDRHRGLEGAKPRGLLFIVLLAIFPMIGMSACGGSTVGGSSQGGMPGGGKSSSITPTFTVDFSAASSAPALVKDEFGVYQTPFMGTKGLPPLTAMEPFLKEAGVRDLRYEIGWGKGDTFAFNQIAGTASSPTIDFSQLDPFMQMLKNDSVTPLLALTYDPVPFQLAGGTWQNVPDNLIQYQNVVQQFIRHYQALGLPSVYYEVWNEPDDANPLFFTGNTTDYGNIYTAVLNALTASAATDAKIGGPAIAYNTSFLAQSGILNQRMDFASIHAYANAPSQLANFVAALGGKKVPIFMTEYGSFSTNGPTDPNSTYVGAMKFFNDVKMLLTESGLKKVYWAQWIDDSDGMITYSLHRKAIFNAYKIYQTMLPVNRVTVTPDSDSTIGIDTLAATGSNGSGIVLWNTGTAAVTITVNLKNIPSAVGMLDVYRIDSTHADYVSDNSAENLSPVDQISYTGGSVDWTGTVPGQAVVFLNATLNSTTAATSVFSGSPMPRAMAYASSSRAVYATPMARASCNEAIHASDRRERCPRKIGRSRAWKNFDDVGRVVEKAREAQTGMVPSRITFGRSFLLDLESCARCMV
jgi:hypothetical protein